MTDGGENDPNLAQKDEVRQYNQRWGGDRSWVQMLRNAPFLFDQLINEIQRGNGRILIRNWQLIMYFISGFLYLLSPLDIIPEAIFGVIGLIDDFMVVIIIVVVMCNTFY